MTRRRARPDESWAGLTAPVTRLGEGGAIERYDVPVEVWIVEGPAFATKTRIKAASTQATSPTMVDWKPTHVDATGIPVFVLG